MAGIQAPVFAVKDGEEATHFVDQADGDASAPCPSLVILDLNLPKKPGFEVLKHLRKSPRCRQARVIVVSSSRAAQDREAAMTNGGDAYFSKPSKYDEFLKLGDLIREWLPKPQK